MKDFKEYQEYMDNDQDKISIKNNQQILQDFIKKLQSINIEKLTPFQIKTLIESIENFNTNLEYLTLDEEEFFNAIRNDDSENLPDSLDDEEPELE